MRILATGAAGFIGSNMAEELIHEGHEVTVWDNLTTGRHEWIPANAKTKTGDVNHLARTSRENFDAVFHFQAHADVRFGQHQRALDFHQNVICTRSILEFCARTGVKQFLFSSSAVVYGEPSVFPTPESYAGTQTSMYGASKAACEAMIQAYANYFQFKWWIFRFVSFMGRHYHHGVVADFVKALKQDNTKLPILGNGNQRKSYLDVRDGVLGMLTAWDGEPGIYNLGHDDSLRVRELADVVCDEMKIKKVHYSTQPCERGWVGDAPLVRLDTTKIKSLGWTPTISIPDSIRATVRELIV